MTGPSIVVTANAGGEGNLSMVGSAQGTSGWDGPPVTTNQVVPSGGYSNTSLSQLTKQNQQSMQAQISAPVLTSASNFQVNTGRMMTAGIDEFGSLICRALAGIDILGLHPFGFMSGWADALDAQASQALGTAQNAQATANTAVNAVNNQQQQKTSGGASVSVSPFPPGFSGTLGPGWVIGGSSGTAPWVTGQYGASLNPQPSKQAVPGFRYGLSTTGMLTDSHTVSGVIGNGDPNSLACTSLIVRAAADMSSFIYVNVFSRVAYLGAGSFNPSSGAWTFNDWGSTNGADFTLYGGDTLSLAIVSGTAIFSRNGHAILSHSDTSAVLPGPSNRNVGLLSQQTTDTWGNVSVGWTMASFTAADTASPPTLGTGWSIYRGTVSPNVGMSNGGSQWHRLWGVFDTVRQSTNSIKWADTPSGAVYIPTTGWWSVSMGCNFGSTLPLGACGGFSVIPKGTSGSEAPVRFGHFYDTQPSGSTGPEGYSFIVAASAVLYLNAGDVLSPIVLVDAQTTYNLNVTGNGSGSATYFDGAFMGNN